MVFCNNTLDNESIVEEPLWGNVTFHKLGLSLSASFGLVSIVLSFYLIFQHATHYLRPHEQKHIIRILVMVPIYSLISFLSYRYYHQTIYFQVVRDCYDAFAIASFFALMCAYIAPNLHDQKEYFRTVTPKNWFLGVFYLQKCTGGENKGFLRKPRSGLTWFNIIWIGIFQYCFIRILFTIISVITEAAGVYCAESDSPAFAHVWVNTIQAIAVTIAMFMVIQFYIQLREVLRDHKPFLKVLSIKLVIFFSFWQTTVISFLSSHGPLKATSKISYPDISIGLPSMLLCIEMAGFAVLHLFAFPWKVYRIENAYTDTLGESGSGYGSAPSKYQGGPLGSKAMMEAMNPWDFIKACARGLKWIFVGYRQRMTDSSYHVTKLSVNSDPDYAGPTFAGSGEPATELRPSGLRLPGEPPDRPSQDPGDDDRTGLLGHSQAPAQHLDMPMPPRRTASPAGSGVDLDDIDTAYHPHMGPPPGSMLPTGGRGDVHPAYRHTPPPDGTTWHRQADSLGDPNSLDLSNRPPPPYPTR